MFGTPTPLKRKGEGGGGGGEILKSIQKRKGFRIFSKKGGVVKIGEVVVKKRVSLTEKSPF